MAELVTTTTPEAVATTSTEVVNVHTLLKADAQKYRLSSYQSDWYYSTLRCESENFVDAKIQSKYVKNGKREQSFGYAQINLPTHPDISYASATDPVFALDYAAKNFADGNTNQWTCHQLIKEGKYKLYTLQ